MTNDDIDVLTDEQLAVQIIDGLEEGMDTQTVRLAFSELYDRHATRLLAFLASRVKRSKMEDMHQEVWLRVWKNLPKHFHGGNFRAWLYQIARNYLIDESRRKQEVELADERVLVDEASIQSDKVLIEQERKIILERCLGKLEEEMASLVRSRLGGENYQDICQRLNLEEAQAHKLFFRAKKQLTICVEQPLQ